MFSSTQIASVPRGCFAVKHIKDFPCTDTNGHPITSEDNGIGFDKLAYLPCKHQVAELLFIRFALCNHLQFTGSDHAKIASLHQQATIHTAQFVLAIAVSQCTGDQ